MAEISNEKQQYTDSVPQNLREGPTQTAEHWLCPVSVFESNNMRNSGTLISVSWALGKATTSQNVGHLFCPTSLADGNITNRRTRLILLIYLPLHKLIVRHFECSWFESLVEKSQINYLREWINPFTATACKPSGMKDARTCVQTVFSVPITHHLWMFCVFMIIHLHASATTTTTTTKKGLRVWNFALLLVVFKWHHGSEEVSAQYFGRV